MTPIKKGMKEAVTRDGRKATQLVWFDAEKSDYLVHGVVEGQVFTWTVEGYQVIGEESRADIFAPMEYEWQWLVKHEDGFFAVSSYYESEDDLKNIGGFVSVNGWSIVYRIEESKREVLTE